MLNGTIAAFPHNALGLGSLRGLDPVYNPQHEATILFRSYICIFLVSGFIEHEGLLIWHFLSDCLVYIQYIHIFLKIHAGYPG